MPGQIEELGDKLKIIIEDPSVRRDQGVQERNNKTIALVTSLNDNTSRRNRYFFQVPHQSPIAFNNVNKTHVQATPNSTYLKIQPNKKTKPKNRWGANAVG